MKEIWLYMEDVENIDSIVLALAKSGHKVRLVNKWSNKDGAQSWVVFECLDLNIKDKEGKE